MSQLLHLPPVYLPHLLSSRLPATIWQLLNMQVPMPLVTEAEGNWACLLVSHWPVLLLRLEKLLHLPSHIPLAPVFVAGLHSIQQMNPESYDSLTFCLDLCRGQLGSMGQRKQETSNEARKTSCSGPEEYTLILHGCTHGQEYSRYSHKAANQADSNS